jgi:hypothetical protein
MRELSPFFEHRFRVVYSIVANVREIDEIRRPAVRVIERKRVDLAVAGQVRWRQPLRLRLRWASVAPLRRRSETPGRRQPPDTTQAKDERSYPTRYCIGRPAPEGVVGHSVIALDALLGREPGPIDSHVTQLGRHSDERGLRLRATRVCLGAPSVHALLMNAIVQSLPASLSKAWRGQP